MSALKWITGLIGWASGGPIGALIGYFIGSAIENGLDGLKQIGGGGSGTRGTWTQTGPGSWTYTTGRTSQSGNAAGPYSSSTRSSGGYSTAEQRNSFMLSLLVLSSAVIRADNRFLQSEFDYVRAFIRRNFGSGAEEEAIRILNDLNHKEINIYSVGWQIQQNMNYSQRLQLFHYLAGIANLILGIMMYSDRNREFSENDLENRINKAKLLIGENYATGIRLEDIATEINMSYSWFRKLFKEYTGFSPASYIQEMKLQKAKSLLISSNLSLKEIAFSLNFDTVSYFSSAFRKKTGYTPLQYRMSIKKP